MENREIEILIEGLLFAYGDRLSLNKIARIIEMDRSETKKIINNLILKYQETKRGMQIREINDGYQMCTKPSHFEFYKKLFETRARPGLSQAAYETLSIIAYNQPITRSQIEYIRGVNSDSSLHKLIDRELVKEAGKSDSVGKPMTFKTTNEFLRSFGYSSIKDLPTIESNEINTVGEEQEEQKEEQEEQKVDKEKQKVYENLEESNKDEGL